MNDEKTEFIPVVQKHISAIQFVYSLKILVGVPAVKQVKNLGFYLRRHLDMTHACVKDLSSVLFTYETFEPGQKYLPKSTKERVVNATITA